jgi:CRP/FNR family cyclic AMP-dependent transcriptional regulator
MHFILSVYSCGTVLLRDGVGERTMMEMDDLAALLARHPLFAQLTADERTRICVRSISRQYRRGAIIFSAGDSVRAFKIVRSGTVRLLKRASDGREQTVTFADIGETLGEIAIFANRSYMVDAEAFTDVALYALPAQQIRHLLHSSPQFTEVLVTLFANRIGHLYEIIEDLAFRSAVARVAHLLLEETHVLTQTQMASIVGMSREALNRALHVLEQQGAIRIESGHATYRSRVLLEAIALQLTPSDRFPVPSEPASMQSGHRPVRRVPFVDLRDASSRLTGGGAAELPKVATPDHVKPALRS